MLVAAVGRWLVAVVVAVVAVTVALTQLIAAVKAVKAPWSLALIPQLQQIMAVVGKNV